jgi:flagellar M-ring protein FliF
MLVRRGKKKKQEAEQKAVEELLAVAMPQQTEDGVQLDENGEPVGADVMDLHTERSMELRQSIRDYVDENMEVAALLIKSWLKEDGDNG